MIEQGQILKIKQKVTYLPPDEWLVLERVETKKRIYYRVQLNNSKHLRPIAILDQKDLELGLNEGKIELGKKRKIKYNTNKK